jgi:uncharacterized DUF497 family protein
MIVLYTHQECCAQLFSWDSDKNRTNKTKHKVSFELASLFVHDPTALTDFDRTVRGEDRETTLALVGSVVLFIVHCEKKLNYEKTIRIISARKATAEERSAYVRQASR